MIVGEFGPISIAKQQSAGHENDRSTCQPVVRLVREIGNQGHHALYRWSPSQKNISALYGLREFDLGHIGNVTQEPLAKPIDSLHEQVGNWRMTVVPLALE